MNPIPVSFIFDDGFSKSCRTVAELFESRNLSATFAVLVKHEGFMVDFPKGNFELWNELQQRGHEIHPHGWDHSDLSKLTREDASRKIDDCLAAFSENLKGFDASRTVYHLTYNRSTPEIDTYLLERMNAIRTNGPQGLPSNGLNSNADLSNRMFNCAWHGPKACDTHLLKSLEAAATSHASHFCYMLHGLDDEGWGPIGKDALVRALDTVAASPNLIYQPIGTFAANRFGVPRYAK